MAECLSCANFDRSHDGFATILNLGPNGAPSGAPSPSTGYGYGAPGVSPSGAPPPSTGYGYGT